MGRQVAEISKNVSRMIGQGIITEEPFGARKKFIFENPDNRRAKNSKNHSKFLRKFCQIRFFSYFPVL